MGAYARCPNCDAAGAIIDDHVAEHLLNYSRLKLLRKRDYWEGRGFDVDDLISIIAVHSFRAIDRYDAARGPLVPFLFMAGYSAAHNWVVTIERRGEFQLLPASADEDVDHDESLTSMRMSIELFRHDHHRVATRDTLDGLLTAGGRSVVRDCVAGILDADDPRVIDAVRASYAIAQRRKIDSDARDRIAGIRDKQTAMRERMRLCQEQEKRRATQTSPKRHYEKLAYARRMAR